jgi:transposase-like protein
VELKLSNLRRKHVKNTTWPKEKKIQAVAQYLALGNMKLVEATTGVSHTLLRQWKMQPWWKEYEIEIRATENVKLDTKLSAIVEKSLETIQDRLENGEVFYNQKTGALERKPVVMKDAAKVATDLLTKRELLRGNATQRTDQTAIPVQDQLKLLAQEFARMTGKEIIDVQAVEVVHDIRDASIVRADDESEGDEELRDAGGIGRDDEYGPDDEQGLEESGLDQSSGEIQEGQPWNNNP